MAEYAPKIAVWADDAVSLRFFSLEFNIFSGLIM